MLLLVGWSVYQYAMVRQLKQIRRQLIDANKEITRQSRRAMESEKMKTAFINSMCHEIRTPFNAINGFSDLLLEGDHDHTKVDSFKPGSGIGLYLCRLIVTRLGDEIHVCPDYREGCSIEITHPY